MAGSSITYGFGNNERLGGRLDVCIDHSNGSAFRLVLMDGNGIPPRNRKWAYMVMSQYISVRHDMIFENIYELY